MSQELESPDSAGGPLRPHEPKKDWLMELIALGHKLVDRFSEEAVVILAVLAFKAVMAFRGAPRFEVDNVAFVALSGYLSLRLLKLMSKRS